MSWTSEVSVLGGGPVTRHRILASGAQVPYHNALRLLGDDAGFRAFLTQTLAPISARLAEFRADPAKLDAILVKGAEKAEAAAEPTLAGAYRALGLPSRH